MKATASLLALVAVMAALPVQAQDDEEQSVSVAAETPRPPLLGRPYFGTVMGSYLLTDEDRGTKDGYGGVIGFGRKITDRLAVEVNGFYSQMDPETGDGSAATLTGGGIGAMVFPVRQFPNVFGLVAVNYQQTDDHPGPASSASYTSTAYDTGIGYLYRFSQLFAVRAEARLRMDAHGNRDAGTKPGENQNFYDGVFNLGVLIPWGETEPAPKEVAQVVSDTSGDSDNDGVPDNLDECPGTPAGAVVNERGCEQDTDGDGVPDRIDQCPDTPAGTAVNEVGCPLDSDGDGVPDHLDECPNTPPGTKVLPNGCALQADCRRPGPGEQADENGCAVATHVLRGVNFEFDSDRLTEEAKAILVDVAATLQTEANVTARIEVRGHTDFIGTDEYNQGLSERRAASVKAFLVEQGIAAERMTTIGFGESQPVDPAQTDEARARNRRVEIKVLE